MTSAPKPPKTAPKKKPRPFVRKGPKKPTSSAIASAERFRNLQRPG